MSAVQAEVALRTGQDEYKAKRYKHALEQFTRVMRMCKCNRGKKRDRCTCKNFEAVADKGGCLFQEAMYKCTCGVSKMFSKCDNPIHIKALDYRAATFEALKELDRARRDAEWILELAPRLPDGYLRLGKISRLQKKDEYAWKVYSAGVDAGNANRMAGSPKFQQLYQARNKLHLRFCRKDPIALPAELFLWVLSYCDLVTRVKCQRVSKTWMRTLTSRDFSSLWKVLDFTGSSTPRRPPRIDFLKKLVASAGRDVRKIVIEEKKRRFQLSQAKLYSLLQGAVRLEHLELSFPDHTLRIPPTAGICKSLKTLSLRFFTAEPKKGIIGLDYIPVSAYPFELLHPVAETVETLHLCGLPMSWFREENVPFMPKVKNLRLQMRPGSTAMFPILHLGTKVPALEQLWLHDTLPDRSKDWEDQWSKSWPNLKVLVVVESHTSMAARFSTALLICLLTSLNYGNKLEHVDLDLPWSPDPDAPAIEPLMTNPSPAISTVWNMTGTVLDPADAWQNDYKSLRTVRLANAALNPTSVQNVVGDQAASGMLQTMDIVFPPDPLSGIPGAVSSAHLAKYEWLTGSPGIQCMSMSQFRFKPFPRTKEDMPLPTFLATFPSLETLEIRSDHYEEAELGSVISAIIKESAHLKVIYQSQVRGALMDKLAALAESRGIRMVWGERPRQWPVQVTS